jgi:hypothetical protein
MASAERAPMVSPDGGPTGTASRNRKPAAGTEMSSMNRNRADERRWLLSSKLSSNPESAAPGCRKRVSELGAPEGIRTPNLLIRSQMLYPLSYGRLGLSLFNCVAEARGFEPPVRCNTDNSLAVSPIRPLWHAS